MCTFQFQFLLNACSRCILLSFLCTYCVACMFVWNIWRGAIFIVFTREHFFLEIVHLLWWVYGRNYFNTAHFSTYSPFLWFFLYLASKNVLFKHSLHSFGLYLAFLYHFFCLLAIRLFAIQIIYRLPTHQSRGKQKKSINTEAEISMEFYFHVFIVEFMECFFCFGQTQFFKINFRFTN